MKENKLVYYSLLFIALVVLAIVLKTFQQVMRPLAIAALLMFIVTPLARFSKKRKIPVWITFAVVLSLGIGLLSLIGSLIQVENLDLNNALPQFKERIQRDSGGILALASKLGLGMDAITPEKLAKIASEGIKMGIGAARTVFSEILLALILLMFLVQSQSGLFSAVERRFGKDEVKRLEETLLRIEGDIIAYLGTKSAMSLGTAVGTGIVLFLFKAKFVYISLLVVFLLNFIPIIGSMIAVIIIVLLYVLSFGLAMKVLWLFLLLMAVQILFGSILEPKIAGDRLNMSPILIILSLYLWGWIWGIIGMLLSVPLTILIMITVKHMGQMETSEDIPVAAD